MAVRRDKTGRWRYRVQVKMHDGGRERINGTPTLNTKEAALKAERAHIERTLDPRRAKKIVPTFANWFWGEDRSSAQPAGRFWIEWVIANRNKPSERRSKVYAYEKHLRDEFGNKTLDEIDAEAIARFRAKLLGKNLSEKRINNVVAVLSKALRWAEEVGVIDRAPRVRFFKIEQPEIEFYSFEEYARLIGAAAKIGPRWYAAVCLAGEAGLRVGEVKGIRWREDIDMVARTVTVNQQVLRGDFGTPKGRTRRTIPMSARLYDALRALSTVREGLLLRRDDGKSMTDSHAHEVLYKTCRLAQLPERGWHILRHTFATNAALFGINPWTLNSWLGHKDMAETHRYVHVAEQHRREIPPVVLQAGAGLDGEKKILAMLAARAAIDWRGNSVATTVEQEKEPKAVPMFS